MQKNHTPWYKMPLWVPILSATIALVVALLVAIPRYQHSMQVAEVRGWCLPSGTYRCGQEFFSWTKEGVVYNTTTQPTCGTLAVPVGRHYFTDPGATVMASVGRNFVSSCKITVKHD